MCTPAAKRQAPDHTVSTCAVPLHAAPKVPASPGPGPAPGPETVNGEVPLGSAVEYAREVRSSFC